MQTSSAVDWDSVDTVLLDMDVSQPFAAPKEHALFWRRLGEREEFSPQLGASFKSRVR